MQTESRIAPQQGQCKQNQGLHHNQHHVVLLVTLRNCWAMKCLSQCSNGIETSVVRKIYASAVVSGQLDTTAEMGASHSVKNSGSRQHLGIMQNAKSLQAAYHMC
jgi:hypothetical protein